MDKKNIIKNDNINDSFRYNFNKSKLRLNKIQYLSSRMFAKIVFDEGYYYIYTSTLWYQLFLLI